MNEQRLATALGWFSIGLGLAEIVAPRKMARAIGVKHHGFLPLLGLREITSGLGILTQQQQRKRAGWVWSRVAGDMMDLAVLGGAFRANKSFRSRVAMATAAVAGVTALDFLCSRRLTENVRSSGNGQPKNAVRVHKAIIVNRPAEELYAFWRNFENLTRFMLHLESVTVTGPDRSHWVAKAPLGAHVEWDAEIVEDRRGQMIAWRSLPGADVDNTGTVRFEPAVGGRGTIVRVALEYKPPGGVVGAKLAKLLGEAPEKQIPEDLRRFKQLMETGEIPTTEGQPAGRRSSTSKRYDKVARQMAAS